MSDYEFYGGAKVRKTTRALSAWQKHVHDFAAECKSSGTEFSLQAASKSYSGPRKTVVRTACYGVSQTDCGTKMGSNGKQCKWITSKSGKRVAHCRSSPKGGPRGVKTPTML